MIWRKGEPCQAAKMIFHFDMVAILHSNSKRKWWQFLNIFRAMMRNSTGVQMGKKRTDTKIPDAHWGVGAFIECSSIQQYIVKVNLGA